ncbi:MAG: endolytic transglycosylase MltG [Cytophagales bacterium]|nr:MAG: endolytic transglycosylase MltG [Cytophagales bacterium]
MAKSKKNIEKDKKTFQKRVAYLLIFGITFAFISFYAYQMLFADNLLVNKEDKILFIRKGATFEEVKDTLEQSFLHDRLSFMFLSKLTGYREKIMPGRYEIKANSSNFQLFKKILKGRQDPLKLTLTSVRTKDDLALRISYKLSSTQDSVLMALNDNTLAMSFGFNDTNFVAMFLPDTYEIYWTWTPKEVFDVFQKSYQKFWDRERLEKARSIGLSPIDVSIMASIVEAETYKNEEKPRIAGVYMNRYVANQRLQADPTLIFATQDFTAKRVTEYHRYFKSPYNTYMKKGLPPGPINIPSQASIDAVLNYEKHAYYFFCANPELNGFHLFSKTFDEHLEIGRKYWQSLDKAGIH